MKIAVDQLRNQLARGLAPVYVISGEDPLLVQEAAALVRDKAREAGCSERNVFQVDARFKWDELYHAACSVSMFADKRLFELRMNEPKPGNEGSKALVEYAASKSSDNVLLVVTGKMDNTVANSAWVSALEKVGVVVQVWPIESARLPQWLQQRASGLGLTLTPSAAQLVADRVQGNLLAASQELEKLRLLIDGSHVDEDAVQKAVVDSARFDVFGLMDTALAGDAVRAIRTLNGLRAEGEELPIMLWAVARELRTLVSVSVAFNSGAPMASALQKARVWQKRQQIVTRAVQRIKLAELRRMITRCSDVDRMIKGLLAEDPWQALTDLVLTIAGRPALVME